MRKPHTRKAMVSLLLCALLLCLYTAPAFALWTVQSPYDPAYIHNPSATDRLHLRKEPRAGAASLGKYYNGVVAELLEETNSDWYKVRIGNTVGYMQAAYLRKDAAGAPASAIPYATVANPNAADRLNLRADRSGTAKSLGKYENGTRVEVLGYGTSWHHVRVDGVLGYMMAKYLVLDGEGTVPAPSSTPGTGGVPGTGNVPIALAVVNNPVSTDRLNLRDSIGPKGESNGLSIGKYYSGVQVDILEYVPKGNEKWVMAQIGNRIGFMQEKFLAIDAKPGTVKSAIPTLTVKNPKATDRLNLRETPSSTAKSLGKYENGTKVEVLGIVNDTWYHVRVDGILGFMMSKYLTPKLSF